MKSARRPAVALLTTIVLVVLQAVADPTGLLALVGWSGALPRVDAVWTWAPYLVYLPVLLGVVWWAAVRAGDRFWTLASGVVLAVMLAQAAACLVMTWDLATAGWAAGYVTAKAVPAALIVAAFTRWFGGRSDRPNRRSRRSGSRRSSSPRSRRSSRDSGGRAPSTPRESRRPTGPRRALGDRGDAAHRRCDSGVPPVDARTCTRSARRLARRARGRWGRGSRASRRRARGRTASRVTSGRSWPRTSPSRTDSRSAPAPAGSWVSTAVLADRIHSARTARMLQLAAGMVAVGRRSHHAHHPAERCVGCGIRCRTRCRRPS